MSYEEEARMSDSVWVQVGRAHPWSLAVDLDAAYARLRAAAPTRTARQSFC
jgi:hypothetical protein